MFGVLDTIINNKATGWALDPNDHNRRLSIELLINGHPIAATLADKSRVELSANGITDNCHGFSLDIPRWLSNLKIVNISARIANTDILLSGSPQVYECKSTMQPRFFGFIEAARGLSIFGYAVDRENPDKKLTVEAYRGAELLASCKASTPRWDLAPLGIGSSVGGFILKLPLRIADGKPHLIKIIISGADELIGSPIEIAEHPIGIAELVHELVDIRVAETLIHNPTKLTHLASILSNWFREHPTSVPLSDWSLYRSLAPDHVIRKLFATISSTKDMPRPAIILYGENLEHYTLTIASIGKQTLLPHSIYILSKCSHPNLQTIRRDDDIMMHESSSLHEIINHITTSNILTTVFVLGGTLLHAQCLELLVNLMSYTGGGIIYPDHEVYEPETQKHLPILKPDWDYDIFLTHDLFGPTWLVNSSQLHHIPNSATIYDVEFHTIEHTHPTKIIHCPTPLATTIPIQLKQKRFIAAQNYIKRNNISVELHQTSNNALHAIWSHPSPSPSISCIIPTRDHPELLSRCVDSLIAIVCRYNAEIIIVDNNSQTPDAIAMLQKLGRYPGVKILSYTGSFNFSAIINTAADEAQGDILLLINDDVEFPFEIQHQWMDALVGYFSRPEVGTVGVKLLYADGLIQHAGVVLGVNGLCDHAFRHLSTAEQGYLGFANSAKRYSAVTAACMATRSKLFRHLGGFDTTLAVSFNDVDYCLRAAAIGYISVYTPFPWAWHKESASRGPEDSQSKQARSFREAEILRTRWQGLIYDDPCYHPMLNLDGLPYVGLSLPPRERINHWGKPHGKPDF